MPFRPGHTLAADRRHLMGARRRCESRSPDRSMGHGARRPSNASLSRRASPTAVTEADGRLPSPLSSRKEPQVGVPGAVFAGQRGGQGRGRTADLPLSGATTTLILRRIESGLHLRLHVPDPELHDQDLFSGGQDDREDLVAGSGAFGVEWSVHASSVGQHDPAPPLHEAMVTLLIIRDRAFPGSFGRAWPTLGRRGTPSPPW